MWTWRRPSIIPPKNSILTGATAYINDILSSVFRNILNNAVQHNHNDKPVIEVGCRATDEMIRIGITDDGSGIPDDQKDSVFGRDQERTMSPDKL